MAGLVKDKRGAVSVQMALYLPIFIIILVGAFEVWKVMYVQQVLNDAAYQGVRLMVMQANASSEEPRAEIPVKAEKMIRRYVSQAAFVGAALREDPDNQEMLQVQIDYYPPQCGSEVQVEVVMPWIVGREWGGRPVSGWLPFLKRSGLMRGYARGTILCEREEDVYGE